MEITETQPPILEKKTSELDVRRDVIEPMQPVLDTHLRGAIKKTEEIIPLGLCDTYTIILGQILAKKFPNLSVLPVASILPPFEGNIFLKGRSHSFLLLRSPDSNDAILFDPTYHHFIQKNARRVYTISNLDLRKPKIPRVNGEWQYYGIMYPKNGEDYEVITPPPPRILNNHAPLHLPSEEIELVRMVVNSYNAEQPNERSFPSSLYNYLIDQGGLRPEEAISILYPSQEDIESNRALMESFIKNATSIIRDGKVNDQTRVMVARVALTREIEEVRNLVNGIEQALNRNR